MVTRGYASRGGDSSAVQADLCAYIDNKNDASWNITVDDIVGVALLVCKQCYQIISMKHI